MWMEFGVVSEDAFQGVVRYERSTERTRPPQLPMQRCVSDVNDGCGSSTRSALQPRDSVAVDLQQTLHSLTHTAARALHNKQLRAMRLCTVITDSYGISVY